MLSLRYRRDIAQTHLSRFLGSMIVETIRGVKLYTINEHGFLVRQMIGPNTYIGSDLASSGMEPILRH